MWVDVGGFLEQGVIRMLGRYELLEQVGSGGMAVVYRGRDSALDREVAVKLLHPHLAGAAESRARFSREARAVARLAHPGIVEIFDYAGDGAPEAYLVTEFVRGRTLRAYAQAVGFGFPEVGLLVGRALCDALVHAHSAGVIHRDLKPENVLVQEDGRPAVKLADFGIARILASDERMTMTGALVGSPHHMAPEIVEGKEADARSDLFSLGTILYWLATARLPFSAGNPTAILRRAIEGDFDDPQGIDPRVSNRLAALLRRCLAVDPAGRPQSAAEVREGIDAVLAEVGLDRPEEALTAFLRDPTGFKAGFPARAVASLMALGEGALREGASARALGFFDRVLALDPANAAVQEKLRGLSRRRRLKRLAGGLGLTLLAAAAFAGLATLWPSAPPPPADGAGARPAEAPPPASPRRRRRPRPRRPPLPARPRPPPSPAWPPGHPARPCRARARRPARPASIWWSTCAPTPSVPCSTAWRWRAARRPSPSRSPPAGPTSSSWSTPAAPPTRAPSAPRRPPPWWSCACRSSRARPGCASRATRPRGCWWRGRRWAPPATRSAPPSSSRCRRAATTPTRPPCASAWRLPGQRRAPSR
jgi:hypothetical protein